ncbi:MAG: hypothetical protein IPN10_01565 [Saprospiraceae bacterium]|nr:hypothetical protein [Saprospiraceae bacterium]
MTLRISDEILYLLNRLSREQSGTTIIIATHDYRLIAEIFVRVIFRCSDESFIETSV